MVRIILLIVPILLFAQEPIVPIPKTISYNAKKAHLGKALFFDPILSADKKISCASCHDPDHGGADPRPVSIGVYGKKGKVNAPTVYNAVFNFRQFWNGRAKDLKEQAHGPLHTKFEMAMDEQHIEKKLNSSDFYKRVFYELYGTKRIHYDQVIDAIVEFEKALITPDAKFDRYLRKEIELSPQEHKGYLYFKELGCITCHNGINIGGNSFQKIGTVVPYSGRLDCDRYHLTKDIEDIGVYKVPTLRNIALTAPYFHDGSVKTLKEAVDEISYHNLGFKLTEEERDAIVAFLKTLTGKKPEILAK